MYGTVFSLFDYKHKRNTAHNYLDDTTMGRDAMPTVVCSTETLSTDVGRPWSPPLSLTLTEGTLPKKSVSLT